MTEEQEKLLAQCIGEHEFAARQIAKLAFALNTRKRSSNPETDRSEYWEQACLGISQSVTTNCEARGLFDRQMIKFFRMTAYKQFEKSLDALDAEFPTGIPDWASVTLDVIPGPRGPGDPLYILNLICDEGTTFGLTGWHDMPAALAELAQWERAGFSVRNQVAEAPRS